MATATLPPPAYTTALILSCVECGATDGLSRWEDDDRCPVWACADSAGCYARQDEQADALAAERECGDCGGIGYCVECAYAATGHYAGCRDDRCTC